MQLITVLFMAVAATFGGILLWWFLGVWWFEEHKFLELLPDSTLERVALDSPEAKAFLVRYPDSETVVHQDLWVPAPFRFSAECSLSVYQRAAPCYPTPRPGTTG